MGYYLKQNRKKKILGQRHMSVCSAKLRAKEITEVLPAEVWKNKRCFLLGGGPSLKNFNFTLIENELVIGVNKSFIRFNTTANYIADMSLHDFLVCPTDDSKQLELQRLWNSYQGIKVVLQVPGKYSYGEKVYVVRRIEGECVSIDLNQGIHPGKNSGLGALMLAVALGANPIYLLGYDFKVEIDSRTNIERTHWHEGYSHQTGRTLQRKLVKFVDEFNHFAPEFERLGINVINLNSLSALKCFPFNTIENILRG